MRSVVSLVVLLITSCYGANYSVSTMRLNNGLPIINSSVPSQDSGSSIFRYNYNVAFIPKYEGLLVRCQNRSDTGPYSVRPSHISYAQIQGSEWQANLSNIQVDPIDEQSIVVEPYDAATSYGTEDPRVALDYSTGLYYLMFSAVQNFSDGSVGCKLALATSYTPYVKSSWKYHGDVFPQLAWSKSAALLIIPGSTSYLYWGDSAIVNGIQLATTEDLLTYNYQEGLFIPMRNDSYFDSALVEAGPMPLELSDGNYIFLYNSARHGFPSAKPGWDLQYNVGFVILNGSDPTQILQRSDEPIFSPELDWEVGTDGTLGLTPNVVFVEGWTYGAEKDTFIAFYGAADSYTGVVQITVDIQY